MSNCYRKNLLTFKRFVTGPHRYYYYTTDVQDVQANETRITSVNQLAKKLLDEGHPDVSLIISKQKVMTVHLVLLYCTTMSHSW